jgi:large subunit ribosomal protein L2
VSFKLFKLKNAPFTSPASRFTFRYFTKWNLQYKYKKLSTFLCSKAGRNDSGRIVFRSRSSKKFKFKTVIINYNYRLRKIAILGTFQIVPLRNKLLSLIFFTNGMVNYIITTEFQKLFSYVIWNTKKKIKRLIIRILCLQIGKFKKLSYISLIEFFPGRGAQYCRSTGTASRIIRFDHTLHTVLLQLPSKVKKIISYYSIAFLGKIALKSSKLCSSNRAGYWRNFGFKPIVRGVAMNPVDHPHGGRTKSVKYPRTPWGKTTKFK